MRTPEQYKPSERCAYLKACYLADDLKCFGYMIDCPLYMKSNGEDCSETRFHAAMDRLIDISRAKHQALNLK